MFVMVPTKAATAMLEIRVLSNLLKSVYTARDVTPIMILGTIRHIIISPTVFNPPAFMIIIANASGSVKHLMTDVNPKTRPKNIPPLNPRK